MQLIANEASLLQMFAILKNIMGQAMCWSVVFQKHMYISIQPSVLAKSLQYAKCVHQEHIDLSTLLKVKTPYITYQSRHSKTNTFECDGVSFINYNSKIR